MAGLRQSHAISMAKLPFKVLPPMKSHCRDVIKHEPQQARPRYNTKSPKVALGLGDLRAQSQVHMG